MQQSELSYIAGGNVKWYSHLESNLLVSYKVEHAPPVMTQPFHS